jgi:hypothetical protein
MIGNYLDSACNCERMVKSCCEAIDFGSQYALCDAFTLCRLSVQDITYDDKAAILEILIDYGDQKSYLGY